MVLAHHVDNDGWYETKKSQCHSCAAMERATTGTDNDPYVPEPGEKMYTQFTRDLIKKPLPPQGEVSNK